MSGIVVIGVDHTETALRAARKAASLALSLDCDLYVLSAFSVDFSETVRSVRSRNELEKIAETYQATLARHTGRAERTAADVAQALRAQHPELDISSKAVEGAPGVALSNEAKRLNADLIVVGNKRVQGPTRILDSIARTVASEASCDVYIVNTHQR